MCTTRAPEGVLGENILDRVFSADSPNQVWLADTTYLQTDEGPAFLVAILDLFGRRIVGWSLGAKLNTELAQRALKKQIRCVRCLETYFSTQIEEESLPQMPLEKTLKIWGHAKA